MNDWAEFRHFLYLKTIFERGGFRSAADHLNTSQPNLAAQTHTGSTKMVPDLLVILPGDGAGSVSVIIENKLILAGEDPGPILGSLKSQMLNAVVTWPDASVVGLVFVAGRRHLPEPKYDEVLTNVVTQIDTLFATTNGFRWIAPDKVRNVFDDVSTEWAYPAMNFSLALYSFGLSLPPAPVAPTSATNVSHEVLPPALRSLSTRPKAPKSRCSNRIRSDVENQTRRARCRLHHCIGKPGRRRFGHFRKP